jgi:hypothetical protein
MDEKYANVAKVAFQRELARGVDKIVNLLWAWTVTTAVGDIAKMITAAINLGGLDSKTVKEFTEDEVKELGAKLEMFRRLEMKTETQEFLLAALADHGIILETPDAKTK